MPLRRKCGKALRGSMITEPKMKLRTEKEKYDVMVKFILLLF